MPAFQWAGQHPHHRRPPYASQAAGRWRVGQIRSFGGNSFRSVVWPTDSEPWGV